MEKSTMRITTYCIITLAIGIVVGRYSVSSPTPTNSPPLTIIQEDFAKWKNIKELRVRHAKDISQKAQQIVCSLSPYSDYSKNNLRISRWGMLFGNTGTEIYYKDELVFDTVDGFLGGIGEVNVFHPGEWIDILNSIDVEKEKILMETKKLQGNYS